MIFRRLPLFVFSCCFMLASAWPAQAREKADHSLWAELLGRYVRQGVVDYAGFKADEDGLDKYLEVLEEADPEAMDRNKAMAFYINVYNAWTVKLILSRWPDLKSIKDLGSIFRSPWKKKIVRLKTGVLTLDEVEHDILRPRFKDPRVHFAVNCASKGCPPLASEPYAGDKLDKQLNAVTRAFINDPSRTWLEGDRLYLNMIFKWFAGDFGDPISFVIKYADQGLKERLEAGRDKIRVTHYDYDWSLNNK